MPTAAELITKIEVHGVDKYSRDLQKVDQDTAKAAGSMDTAGTKAGGLASNLAKIGGAAALGGIAGIGVGLGGAVKVASDFESSLNGVSAATGATSDQMKLMRAESLKIGADTSKGASEAVEAMGELTKSGVSVQDAVGGVARTVVQMSEASGSSVANMATLMSDSLNVFNLGADQAGDTANTLVKAAGASSISIDDLAMSLSAGGLVAKNAGLSIGDFSAAIGILGNQGLKSSDAGTSLKAMIAGLTPTTDKAVGVMKNLGIEVFDAEGKYKSFEGILAELSEGFAGLTQEQRTQAAETLFGSDGIRAFNALIPDTASGMADAVSQFQQFNAAMGQAPSVAEQSEKRLQGLGGEMEKLKGSLETVAIEVGTVLLPALTQVAAFLAENIGPAFETLKSNMGTILPVFGAVAAGLGAMVIAGSVAAAVTTLSTAFAAFSALAANIGPIMALVAVLGGPLTLAIVGIGAAIAVLVLAWTQNWGDIQGKTEAVINAISPIIEALGARLSEFGEVILPELSAAWQQTSDNIGTIANAIRNIVEPIFNGIRDFLNAHRTEITAILQGAWDAIVVIIETVTGVISNTIQFWLNVLQGDWSGAWENVKNIVQITWDGIKSLIEIALSVLPSVISLGMALVQAAVETAWNAIKSAVDAAINGEGGVIAIMRAMPGAILDALGNIGGLLVQVGADLIQGFINGVNSMWDGAINFVKDLFGAVIDGVKDILGISSPSTVMRDAGVNFIQGFIDGAGSLAGALKDFVKGLVGDALSAAKDAAGGVLGAIGGAVGGAVGAVTGGGSSGSGLYTATSSGPVVDMGRQMAAAYGWTGAEFEALNRLWTQESGWNPNARNPTSGAAGIPQALGHVLPPGYHTDPAVQIRWGLDYIRGRYGSPSAALAFEQANGWYGKGGGVPYGLFGVGERGPELGLYTPNGLHIFSHEQSRALLSGMSGGARIPGFAAGTNPATAPAKSNMRLAEAASFLAIYGPITPELARALAEITQMQLDYFSAQAEYLESVRSDKVGRGIAAEIRRFLQWAVANNKQYLLSVADEQGPEAAYEAYHGTGAIDRLWAKYRGTRGDPFAAAVMGAYGIGGIASREADYLVGMANGGLINRHSYLVDAQSGRAWGEVAEGNRPERVVPANTAMTSGAVPDVMGSESLMYRTFDATMFRMEKAIEKLGDRIERMRILMDGQDVGQIVTPHVSQEIAVAVTSTAGGPY